MVPSPPIYSPTMYTLEISKSFHLEITIFDCFSSSKSLKKVDIDPSPIFGTCLPISSQSALESVTYLHIIGFRAKHINPMHCNGVLKVLPFYSSEDSQALPPLPQFQSNCFFSGRAFCRNVHFHSLYFNNTVLSTNITFTYFL